VGAAHQAGLSGALGEDLTPIDTDETDQGIRQKKKQIPFGNDKQCGLDNNAGMTTSGKDKSFGNANNSDSHF
jgi:hypothetical protein